ncbi:VUT family protein [Pseudochrobactrum algeriensis]|uniref:VUT family protein n=1 Tax=Pseudochrobactrum algeriensis TaxID=2834768 RepID=UPI001EE5BDE9|nr:VUT family protein [Pseudochrobactrum algeriensis]
MPLQHNSAIKALIFPVLAMCAAVAASNILVQYPVHYFGLQDILTYGAFTYPFAFLVNDLTNRRFGPQRARQVVYAGFALGVIMSIWLASPRLAVASGSAFLFAQLLDISVFSRLRRLRWWKAPLAAALCGSVLDTILFFSLAFAAPFSMLDTAFGLADSSMTDQVQWFGLAMPLWLSLALGDFGIKVLMSVVMLVPYGAILALFAPSIYGAGKSDATKPAIR